MPVRATPARPAPALLHVRAGDVLQLRDRISDRPVRFVVTGVYRPRQVSDPYWGLNDVGPGGSSTVSGFTTYGPLAVPAWSPVHAGLTDDPARALDELFVVYVLAPAAGAPGGR